ncbi:class I SAM-dependent methyltransferase [Halocynthiibacter namhaensis]|uniref:class I SAM-dependent methyltransferase n=1 Tax=Halocynthiibacter namhaensis TaxID=1290553 RepID=UPI0005794E23|nr:methyltransferase domain-containing protein [Halocynthiibacter namhaensis]
MAGTGIQYPDHFITRLQAIWGRGFLSPGGPEEVKRIVQGLGLTGKALLDIGFGTGGPGAVLAGLGAQVTGTDIEAQLLPHAQATRAASPHADQITLILTKPGPLPFDDNSFDVVFSKDSLIHVPDKGAMFDEILRVLKPSGIFAASDWLMGAGDGPAQVMADFNARGYLDFRMATADQTKHLLTSCGFHDVTTLDRNAWYADLAAREVKKVEEDLYDDLAAIVGEEIMREWLSVRRHLAEAARLGGLCPTHLRAIKPASGL